MKIVKTTEKHSWSRNGYGIQSKWLTPPISMETITLCIYLPKARQHMLTTYEFL